MNWKKEDDVLLQPSHYVHFQVLVRLKKFLTLPAQGFESTNYKERVMIENFKLNIPIDNRKGGQLI